ncbi:MAG: SRPBCC family protein [Verrucomicrobiota bacterium]
MAIPFLANSEEALSPDYWITSAEQWGHLEAGEVVLLDASKESGGSGEGHAATAAILIHSPIEPVWNVVNDHDKAPEFIKSLIASKTIEKDTGYSILQQQVKVGFYRVNYMAELRLKPPDLIEFDQVSGDLKSMDGFWRFISVESETGSKTLLIYRLSLKPDFPVPPFLIVCQIRSSR